MKLNNLCIGRVYNVKSNDGCAILTADGYTLANVPAGGYRIFVAPVTEATVLGDAEVSLDPRGRAAVVGELVGVRQIDGLPVGYVPVEYLESTGKQYILTGAHLTSNAQFRFTAQQLQFRTSTAEFQIGARCASTNTLFVGPIAQQISMSPDAWQVVGGINGDYMFTKPPHSNTEKVNIFLNGNQVKVNGEVVNDEAKFDVHDDSYNSTAITEAALFGVTRAIQNDILINSACRIWEAEIWSDLNKNSVRNYIPVLDSNGAPCMFDTVTRLPFYNSGSGDFLYPGSEASAYSLRQQFPDWGKLTERGLKRLYHVPEGYTGDPYDYAIENGFKHIVETEQPSEGYWTPRWTETDDEIVLVWDEAEPPAEDIPVESEQEPVQ